MAYRRSRTRRRKRRKVRRRSQIGNAVNLTRKPGSILPNSVYCKLKYSSDFALNIPSAGIPAVYIFRANSLYDPDFTGTGHQPRGFDQLMAFYNHYTVVGAKITLSIDSSHTSPCTYGIALRSTTTAGTTPEAYMENGKAIWKVHNWAAGTSGGLRNSKLSYKFSTSKFFNNVMPLDDDVYTGSATGNPAEQAYFHIWAYSNDQSIDPAAEAPTIHIEYLTVFTEPKALSISS